MRIEAVTRDAPGSTTFRAVKTQGTGADGEAVTLYELVGKGLREEELLALPVGQCKVVAALLQEVAAARNR